MSTGWRWFSSDGQDFRSQYEAKRYLGDHPDVTITFSSLSMAGTKLEDVTEQLRTGPETMAEYYDRTKHEKTRSLRKLGHRAPTQ